MTERSTGYTGDNGQAARPRGWSRRETVAWVAGWAAIILLALWLTRLDGIWLAAAALGSAIWFYHSIVDGRKVGKVVAGIALLIAVAVAAVVQGRLTSIVEDWDTLQLRIEERSAAAVEAALNRLLDDGERAVAAAEAASAAYAGRSPDAGLFDRLAAIQKATGVTAIVLFDSTGTARAWSGQHRGTVPVEARMGAERYIFHEGPLFSYLYFVRPVAGGMTAAAAFLLEGSVEPEAGVVPFADRFEREHGPRPRFWIPERAPLDPVWDWATDDGRPIFSVSFVALTQQAWWQRVAASGRIAGGIVALIALLLLSVVWYRSRRAPRPVPALVGTAALLVAPIEALGTPGGAFSPLQFVLPGPFDVTLGTLLILLLGGAVATVGWRHSRRLTPRLAGLALTLIMLAAIVLVRASASDALLADRAGGGFALQLTTSLLVAIPSYLVLTSTSALRFWRFPRLLVWAGCALPVVLALLVATLTDPTVRLPIVLAAA